jgi:catechol 2,3-dioxygenase-like lactoylglutathione lyase family enzyme
MAVFFKTPALGWHTLDCMQIAFISSVAIVVRDPTAAKRLFVDTLGLPLEGEPDDGYLHSEHIGGSKHFGVWPLAQAAQACFGTPDWPSEHPVPQASVEFEVDSEAAVAQAAQELEARGYVLLHPARREPWGQIVARWLSDEGAILGLSYAPWFHEASGA